MEMFIVIAVCMLLMGRGECKGGGGNATSVGADKIKEALVKAMRASEKK